MKSLRRPSWNAIATALLLAGILILSPGASWAEVPSNMNVQGRLTDNLGDPVAPGLKIFTFKIFDAEVNGTEIWPAGAGEDQTLFTDGNGLWSARVGEFIALNATVFADTSRWLEVTVDDGINPAETLTRIKLNTNPWSHQAADASMLEGRQASDFAESIHLHAPADISPQGPTSGLDADLLDGADLGDIQAEIDADVAAHAASADHDTRYYTKTEAGNQFVDLAGDFMSGTLVSPEISVGSSGMDGRLELWMGGPGSPIMVADHSGLNGGYLSLFDATGSHTIDLYPDTDGPGGHFGVMGQFGYLEVDGNYAGTGNPRMTLTGSQSTVIFDTQSKGTDAVRLPSNAIDSTEIIDEPGIASQNSSIVVVLTSSMQDIETVDITIPVGGYIVVEGDCTGRTASTVGRAQGFIQIDQTAGGGPDLPHMRFFGLTSYAGTTGFNGFPVHVARVYFKSSAGTYTFRMEAQENSSNSPAADVSCIDPTLTATFYPTGYGSVATMVSAAEAGEFPSATAVSTGTTDPTDPNAPATGEVLYKVDLRDLEIKLARANAEAERARRELVEAQLMNGRPRPASNPER